MVEPFWWAGFGAIGKWLGAAASFAAVAVALRLALRRERREDKERHSTAREERRRLSTTVSHLSAYLAAPGQPSDAGYYIPEYIQADKETLTGLIHAHSWLPDNVYHTVETLDTVFVFAGSVLTSGDYLRMVKATHEVEKALNDASAQSAYLSL